MYDKRDEGDLFDNITGNCVVPHVTNDCSAWGSGFVLAINKNLGDWARDSFVDASQNSLYGLGNVDYCRVGKGDNHITVANMCAQHGVQGNSTGDLRVSKPIRYAALVACMEDVRDYIESYPQPIMCPRFGSALAGGNWDFIRELIDEIWGELDVTIFEY